MNRALKNMLACSVLALIASATLATPVTNTTGISSPTGTITFSEVPLAPGGTITNQYATYGATFSPFAIFRPQDGYYATDYIGNFDSSGTANPFTIVFNQVLSGAAFDFITNSGNTIFEALLSGSVVESFSAATDTAVGRYFGFDGIAFDSIRLTVPDNGAMEMDNLQIRATSIPEPMSLVLVGLGLAGLAGVRRRQKATS